MKVECEKITSLLLEFYCWTRNREELGGIQKINFTIQAHNCRGDFTEIEKVERRFFSLSNWHGKANPLVAGMKINP